MSDDFEDGLSGLRNVVSHMGVMIKTANGFAPLVPYEKLHRELSDYTNVLGFILKGFDKRLKALEQKGLVTRKFR